MERKISSILAFILPLIVILCMFVSNNGNTSSVTNNMSRGIVLTSTARVKKTECARFKLPSSNPAALVEYGLSDAIEFSDATIDTTLLSIKVPGDIDTSEQPSLQIEWNGEATGDARFEITYLWLAIDETSDVTSGTTITDNYTASTTIKGLVESDIQLSGMSNTDKYLKAKIVRKADHTADTVDSAVVNIFDACLYYISNKLGEPL